MGKNAIYLALQGKPFGQFPRRLHFLQRSHKRHIGPGILRPLERRQNAKSRVGNTVVTPWKKRWSVAPLMRKTKNKCVSKTHARIMRSSPSSFICRIYDKKLSCRREAARCFVFVCSQLQHNYSAVFLLKITAASDLLVHKILLWLGYPMVKNFRRYLYSFWRNLRT